MKDNNTNLDVELMTDYAIDISESANGLCVLIKHDYYSSDNENGKALLDSFLDGLILQSERIFMLIITDSAVKLIQSSDRLRSLIKRVNFTLICSSSAEYYDVTVSDDILSKAHLVPMESITEQIIETVPDLIIE